MEGREDRPLLSENERAGSGVFRLLKWLPKSKRAALGDSPFFGDFEKGT